MTMEKRHWPPGMKAVLLFAVAIAIAVSLAIFTTHYQKKHPPRVQVLGMCIPKSRVDIVMKPGLVNFLLNHNRYLDKTSGNWATVSFTPREMMKAIPGWTGYRWDPQIHFKLWLGLTVGLSADVPMNSGRLTNAVRAIYLLKGPYKDAKVTELGHSRLYKVETRSQHHPGDSWQLLYVDPRDKAKPPVTDWHQWDAAMCFYGDKIDAADPDSCLLNYADQGVSFDVSVDGKNIPLIRQVDAFLSRKVHEWRAACHATS